MKQWLRVIRATQNILERYSRKRRGTTAPGSIQTAGVCFRRVNWIASKHLRLVSWTSCSVSIFLDQQWSGGAVNLIAFHALFDSFWIQSWGLVEKRIYGPSLLTTWSIFCNQYAPNFKLFMLNQVPFLSNLQIPIQPQLSLFSGMTSANRHKFTLPVLIFMFQSQNVRYKK